MRPVREILPIAALPLAVLAIGVLGYVYLVMSKPRLEPAPPQERVWPIAVFEARYGDIEPQLRLYGEVVAGREVELRALVAGEVVSVGPSMVEGGITRKDEQLITIDEFDFRATLDERAAELQEARARLQEFIAMEQASRPFRFRNLSVHSLHVQADG